ATATVAPATAEHETNPGNPPTAHEIALLTDNVYATVSYSDVAPRIQWLSIVHDYLQNHPQATNEELVNEITTRMHVRDAAQVARIPGFIQTNRDAIARIPQETLLTLTDLAQNDEISEMSWGNSHENPVSALTELGTRVIALNPQARDTIATALNQFVTDPNQSPEALQILLQQALDRAITPEQLAAYVTFLDLARTQYTAASRAGVAQLPNDWLRQAPQGQAQP
ncbi:MAG TPA: hypothetical protein VF820_04680, partial [Patescibacteria group bacterium]